MTENGLHQGYGLTSLLIFFARYERSGLIDSGESLSLLKDALALMDGQSYEVPPERILGVARRTGCSGYDSQYVALAEDLGTKLYTCDKKVLRMCPEIVTLPK